MVQEMGEKTPQWFLRYGQFSTCCKDNFKKNSSQEYICRMYHLFITVQHKVSPFWFCYAFKSTSFNLKYNIEEIGGTDAATLEINNSSSWGLGFLRLDRRTCLILRSLMAVTYSATSSVIRVEQG